MIATVDFFLDRYFLDTRQNNGTKFFRRLVLQLDNLQLDKTIRNDLDQRLMEGKKKKQKKLIKFETTQHPGNSLYTSAHNSVKPISSIQK